MVTEQSKNSNGSRWSISGRHLPWHTAPAHKKRAPAHKKRAPPGALSLMRNERPVSPSSKPPNGTIKSLFGIMVRQGPNSQSQLNY